MVAFKTQQGEKYGNNIKCTVNLKVILDKKFPYKYKKLDLIILLGHEKRFIVLSQKTSSCPSLVVSCPKFDIAHKNPNCKGKSGDFLSLGNKRFGAVILRPVNLAVTSLSGSVRTAARKISSRIQRNWQSPSIQTKKLMDRAQIASLHAQILFQRVNTSLILWNSAFSIH